MAGNRLGKMVGKRFEIFGGLVRIAIGLRIVFEHLA
jgi:putative Mn2+ efflux pump MntP